jgi:hypothetical protein
VKSLSSKSFTELSSDDKQRQREDRGEETQSERTREGRVRRHRGHRGDERRGGGKEREEHTFVGILIFLSNVIHLDYFLSSGNPLQEDHIIHRRLLGDTHHLLTVRQRGGGGGGEGREREGGK